jgi:hypothetical protein
MAITSTTDFIGRYSIPIPYNNGEEKLTQYIDFYEAKYLKALFGSMLYLEFIENPEAEKFEPLLTLGLKEAMICVVYGHVKKEDLKLVASTGDITPTSEGGNQYFGDSIIYNQGITIFKELSKYCKETYPNYDGSELLISLW